MIGLKPFVVTPRLMESNGTDNTRKKNESEHLSGLKVYFSC